MKCSKPVGAARLTLNSSQAVRETVKAVTIATHESRSRNDMTMPDSAP